MKKFRIVKRTTQSDVQYIVEKKFLWWWTYAQTIPTEFGDMYVSHKTEESARDWINRELTEDEIINI